jgi:hypothetical protein
LYRASQFETASVRDVDVVVAALASSEGHIQFVLRNPLDQQQPRQRERKPKRLKPVPPPPISPWFPKPIPPERPLSPRLIRRA